VLLLSMGSVLPRDTEDDPRDVVRVLGDKQSQRAGTDLEIGE